MAVSFIIEKANGQQYVIPIGKAFKSADGGEFDLKLNRPVHSEVTYPVGDGLFTPSNLELTIRITEPGGLGASTAKYNTLMEYAIAARYIRFADRSREVWGLSSPFEEAPLVGGYRIRLNWVPKSPRWWNAQGQEVWR